jgi:type I restriction enzyme, S subunit
MNFEKIGNIAKFINGAPFKPSDWVDEGLRIIRIQNLTDPNKPYNRTLKKVDKKYLVKKGDVLVSWSATIDIFLWNDDDALLNQHIFKVNFDKSKVEKSYFIFALKDTINDLSRMAHGSTMKHVVKGDFENHKIPLPTLSTQLHIASILTKAESLIAQRKESIRLLDEYLKSVFLEMFGDPVRNEKKYRIVEISEISTHIKDGPHVSPKYSENGIPILSTRNIRPGKLIMDELKYVSEQTYTELTKRFKPQKFDVLITKGGTTGYAKVVDFDFEFCIWVHLACVRLKSTVNPFYFEHAFNSDYCYFQAQKFTHGITNQDLGLTRIAKIKLLLPPIELQTKFAQIVEKTEALKAQYQQSLQELENLYGSLSQKAFKGELDLKDESLFMAAEPETKYGK